MADWTQNGNTYFTGYNAARPYKWHCTPYTDDTVLITCTKVNGA
jgi:hypothetical protein